MLAILERHASSQAEGAGKKDKDMEEEENRLKKEIELEKLVQQQRLRRAGPEPTSN